MSISCDHNRCETAFCPYCGVALSQLSEGSLLSHLKGSRKRAAKELKRWSNGRKNSPDNVSDQDVKRYADKVEKWDGWISLVVGWIERDRKDSP